MELLKEFFTKIGVNPVRELTEAKLTTILIATEMDLDDRENDNDNEKIFSVVSERLGGFFINDWDLNKEDCYFEDWLKREILIYYKFLNTDGDMDTYIETDWRIDLYCLWEEDLKEEVIKSFLLSKIFTLIERQDPNLALKLSSDETFNRSNLIKKAIFSYANELIQRREIFRNLYEGLPLVIEEERRNEMKMNKKGQ